MGDETPLIQAVGQRPSADRAPPLTSNSPCPRGNQVPVDGPLVDAHATISECP